VRIACYPFASSGDMRENLRHIRTGVQAAAEAGARLVCFHECALTGYPPVEAEIENITEEKVSAGIRTVTDLAREYGLCVLAGTVLYDGGKRYNSTLAFDENGKQICRYDKQALWGWDAENFVPGDGGGVFELDGMKIGVRICFDVRFPELFRPFFRENVPLCIMPFSDTAQTPDPERRQIIAGHLRTRCAENVMQIISVNSLSRYSAAPTAWINQNGRILKETGGESLLLCDVGVPEEDFGMQGRKYNAEKFMKQGKKNG